MDAFASFRTRQLQAGRLSFMDLSNSNSKVHNMELEDISCPGDKPVSQSFLEDLHIVSPSIYVHQCKPSHYILPYPLT